MGPSVSDWLLMGSYSGLRHYPEYLQSDREAINSQYIRFTILLQLHYNGTHIIRKIGLQPSDAR